MDQNEETFEYRYSAKQQEEIEAIRRKYLPKEEDKMEQLRQMDKRVSRKGTIISIIIGVIGCLLLGIGMCCTMEWAGRWFVPGIIIGVIGIVMIALAYPLYERITKKERKKIAPLILKLADELKSKEWGKQKWLCRYSHFWSLLFRAKADDVIDRYGDDKAMGSGVEPVSFTDRAHDVSFLFFRDDDQDKILFCLQGDAQIFGSIFTSAALAFQHRASADADLTRGLYDVISVSGCHGDPDQGVFVRIFHFGFISFYPFLDFFLCFFIEHGEDRCLDACDRHREYDAAASALDRQLVFHCFEDGRDAETRQEADGDQAGAFPHA